jgi:hypothetical protein
MKSFLLRRLAVLAALTACVSLLGIRPATAEAPAPVPGGFTLAVLPDTQMYAWKFPELYPAQTKWIAENARRYHMAYVLHVGDITQHNTNSQWEVAVRAHALMAAVVPCAVTVGNHDLGPEGRATSRDSEFTKFFPLESFRKWPTFGGVYDREPQRTENNFHRFEAGGRKWLILALEFGPRDDVVRWANEVVAQHPDHSAILVTHAYLRPDNSRFDRRILLEAAKNKVQRNKGIDQYALSKSPEGYNDGEDLWQKLVAKHRNFSLVVSGHVTVTGRLDSVGEHGNTVHQMLVDYQSLPNGGDGYLRLLMFHPDGETVTVRDYSPVLDKVSDLPGTQYEFRLPRTVLPARR